MKILWAEPEPPESDAGLYGDGFAGHSTGKTLFCRILRYLLGEPNFGTKELEERVKDNFKSLWAVASIRLDGKTWLVGRQLANDADADFAIENGQINPVLQAAPAPADYKRFTDQIELTCGKPLAAMYPLEAWRNLLPWLARDQEARLSSITAWRDSSSEADNPRNSVTAQHLILRAVLKVLDVSEFTVRQAISSNDEDIKKWESQLPSKAEIYTQSMRRLQRTLRGIPGFSVSLEDLNTAKQYIGSQRSIREESLETFRKQPESSEVLQAREALQLAISTKAKADTQIEMLDKEIPAERERAEKSLATADQVKKKGFVDPQRIEKKFCPNSYLTACQNECVPASPDDLAASMVEIRQIEADAQALRNAVQKKEDEKARLESAQERLEADIQSKRQFLNEILTNNPTPYIKIQSAITLLATAEADIIEVIESEKTEKSIRSNIQNARSTVEVLKKQLESLKLEADKTLEIFSDIFGDITRAVLGSSIQAYADLGERSINLHIKRNKRELGGAAVESIKTLAFDLAAVVHSIEGKCDHPRFLIHDGPREADMARVTYEHFFLWAERMESAFPENEASFQYIITTTTHPPKNMREGSKWLLGEKLSGKNKESRLLQEDF